MAYRFILVLCLCFGPALARAADIMFEGYYRVDLNHKQVGYIVERYAFNPTDKTFETISFLRLKVGDKIEQQSLKGKCTDKFHPISYQYTQTVNDDVKLIDATFKGETMTLKISESKKPPRTETYKNPKDVFLSSFLPYILLQQTLELNQAFTYNGIAEEDGGSYPGKAWLRAKEAKSGYELFTVVNKYHGEEFTSKMAIVHDPKDPKKNIKGEVFGTSNNSGLSTTLVPASQATEGQLIPNKTLLTLFGGVPTGKVNMVVTPPATNPDSKEK